jgi:hypothetical protein
MSEWWTYRLSDFLLFSPQAYFRLFELYNLAVWPAQLAVLGLGAVMALLLWRGGAGVGRIVSALLAAAWLWIAWAFHLQRYATINLAGTHLAAAFAIQAVLLLWFGVVRDRMAPGRQRLAWAGVGLFLFALAYPLIGLWLGRPWTQLEVFGLAPDPTVVATLGVALLASPPARGILLVIPILYCAVGGATLWAMASPEAPVLPLAALLALLHAFTIRGPPLR